MLHTAGQVPKYQPSPIHEYQSVRSMNNNYMCMYAEITGIVKSGLVLFKQMHDINT